MLGYREHEIGRTRGEWLGRVHPDERAPLIQALDAFVAAGERFEFEHRIEHRDGSYRWHLARADRGPGRRGAGATRGSSAPSPTSPTATEAERRLQHDALHDALTGLPNRVLFLDRLDQSIRRAQRHHPECCAAVLFLDLDRFKAVNDSLGHATGRRAAHGGRRAGSKRRCAPTTRWRG